MKTLKNPMFWLNIVLGIFFATFAVLISMSQGMTLQHNIVLIGGIATVSQAITKSVLRKAKNSEYYFGAIFLFTVILAFVFIDAPWMHAIRDISDRGVLFLIGLALQFFRWADTIGENSGKRIQSDYEKQISLLTEKLAKSEENNQKIERIQKNIDESLNNKLSINNKAKQEENSNE